MALEKIDFVVPPRTPSPTASRLIAEADRHWEAFLDANRNRRLPRFVPSEPVFVYSALVSILELDLAPGTRFCEWGSGLGVAACLAADLGYEAYGIEIEQELVRSARQLAQRCGLNVTFLQQSFFPEGYDSYEGIGSRSLLQPPKSKRHLPRRYTGMDRDIEDIDLFYAYPWPEEQQMVLDLFDALAGEETLLLAYFGHADLNLYRKKWDG